MSNTNLPSENERIRNIINIYYDGNESQFSKEIDVSQPRINRLFNVDPRSGKYPLPSFEIAQAIINKFINISAEWLLVGRGYMNKSEPPQLLTPEIRDNSQLLKWEIEHLKKEVSLLRKNEELATFKIQTLEDENLKLKKDREPAYYSQIVAEPSKKLTQNKPSK